MSACSTLKRISGLAGFCFILLALVVSGCGEGSSPVAADPSSPDIQTMDGLAPASQATAESADIRGKKIKDKKDADAETSDDTVYTSKKRPSRYSFGGD